MRHFIATTTQEQAPSKATLPIRGQYQVLERGFGAGVMFIDEWRIKKDLLFFNGNLY